jgi:reverse gyrase
MTTVLVKVREMFSFQQGLSGKAVRLIVDSCQHLKKLSLDGVRQIDDGDVIHVINKLGKQLTTLVLDGKGLTDIAYSYLNNCTR